MPLLPRAPSVSQRINRWLAKVSAWLVLLLPLAPAWAAALNAVDEKAVRTVVQAQLAAFAADDANKAFSYAAPNIQQMFGSPGNFLAMVREQYAVVYRPASVVFLKPETLSADGKSKEVVQQVQMTDANAASWVATYTLAQQKNKVWRITGCIVTANTARMV
jgi:Domain of unknown function (DUF4864)